MKAAAFKELLESVRDAGAYLKGNRKAVAKTNRISPHSVAATVITERGVTPATAAGLRQLFPEKAAVA